MSSSLKEICKAEKCTGCYACVNVCKHSCITMQEDDMGAIHPVIDHDNCIGCQLCVKVCPNNVDLHFNYPIQCYASWITDSDKRRICASGGIGTIISEYTIKNGGIVFGSRYDENLQPVITYTESLEDLEYFKGSRYVQSLIGNETLKEVQVFLKTGRKVLFIGTPCQIAGLKTFLRKEYDNLITVDLICHGVCPTKYLSEEVSFLSDKFKLKDAKDIRFRGNDRNNFCLTLWNKDRQKLFPRNNFFEKIFRFSDLHQYYISGFLLGVSLRENCYTCNYARPERISDITIGDFIGLGKRIPFNYSKSNVSSVIINTLKGKNFYELVSANIQELMNVERKYDERLEYEPSLKYPFPRHKLNALFSNYYKKEGYIIASRKTLKNYLYKKVSSRIIKLPIRAVKKISNIIIK